MSTVVNRADPTVFIVSANEPDFPLAQWLHSPPGFAALSDVVPSKYWKVVGEDVAEMNQSEKDAVDAAEAAELIAANRAEAVADVDASAGHGVRLRALVELFNKRDNYLTQRIIELQDTLTAMKESNGPLNSFRDSIPSAWLPTSTRPRPQAVQEYKDDINAGKAD